MLPSACQDKPDSPMALYRAHALSQSQAQSQNSQPLTQKNATQASEPIEPIESESEQQAQKTQDGQGSQPMQSELTEKGSELPLAENPGFKEGSVELAGKLVELARSS